MQGKAEYSKLRKKYKNLPDWEWLNRNFKIKMEEDGHILEQIRCSIVEKLDMMARSIIEPIIGGGENYCCYYERTMLSSDEKTQMFEIYKMLQSLLWKSNSIAVDFDEKDAADWLIEVKDKFEDIRPVLTKLCEKLADGWGAYKKHEVETAYHG
ncbi:MAG: hypothetical protein QXD77_03410 [Candidatus Aenigmatarchaeota archaeon]